MLKSILVFVIVRIVFLCVLLRVNLCNHVWINIYYNVHVTSVLVYFWLPIYCLLNDFTFYSLYYGYNNMLFFLFIFFIFLFWTVITILALIIILLKLFEMFHNFLKKKKPYHILDIIFGSLSIIACNGIVRSFGIIPSYVLRRIKIFS